ncbi:MAG: Trk system potassium transporter TrkA [Bacteroidales bacterium]|jgi:trk system potassium uptake protein TrkA|nr:Trk system potassium transporter TrkA [Bacteroidales bacterium]
MNIIIAGAGDVGEFLAKMLIKENHDITIIDVDSNLLAEINSKYDLLSIVGSCYSIETLKEAKISSCDLFIAVTSVEETNLLACILAKKNGAKKTIARINNMEFLNPINKLTFINLGIDKLIYPEYIASKEIVGVLKQTGTSEIFEFSDGKLSLFVLKIDENSKIKNKSLIDIANISKKQNYRFIAIMRGEKTIIPKGTDILEVNDIAYVILNPQEINDLLKFMGIQKLDINSVMFLGGSRVGTKSAKLVQSHLNVKMFERDEEKCYKLQEELQDSMIINHDGTDINQLLEEGLENMDAFVATTGESEINILACLLAKKYGVKKTIAEVENNDYIELANQMGIDKIINKKLSTASYIYTFTMKAKVASISWLAGTDAEVLEFVTSKDAKVTKNKIKDIVFPEGVIVGGVVRNNKSFIAVGDTQIKENDKVILFATASAIHKIEHYF